jgi:MFS family permease
MEKQEYIKQVYKKKHPPVWIYGLMMVPYGVAGSFASATLGKILQKYNVPEDKIASVIALSLFLAGLQFLWAPLVDIRLRRRSWYVIMALSSAAMLMIAMLTPLPGHVDLFILLVLASQVVNGLTSACLGGLMATTLPDDARGKASGYLNAGNVGAGAVGAGVSLYFFESHSLPLVGAVTSLMMAVPAFIAFFIPEPKPQERTIGETFRIMIKEVWATAKARTGWTGILLCISPVGTAAVLQLFTSFSDSYHAPDRMVTIINGFLGGVITMVSCILGGYICDRVHRRYAYMFSAVLTAICATAIGFAPFTPNTYVIGCLTYLFISGFCYAAFTAFVLEIIGDASSTASTQYSLFVAAANIAIAYVVKLDGWGFEFWKRHYSEAQAPRGLLFIDAALNIVGIIVLLALYRILRPSSVAPASAAAD